jgi:zinc-ribbon domain/FHA domain
MNCPNCDKPVRDGAAFCGECGFKLAQVSAGPVPAAIPVVDQPLRRPPPPPDDEDEPDLTPVVIAVEAVAQHVVAPIPDVAPLLVPPPPPATASKVVEVVSFGATEDVPAHEPAATITIGSPPPGVGAAPVQEPVAPPPVEIPKVEPAVATPQAESVDETRVSVRRRGGAHWRLVLPDARQIDVPAALLVGRDPAKNPKWPAAILLSIDDNAHSVSKTHALFETDASGLWVTDLDSSNGVVITASDGTERDLDPNVRAQIDPGSDVELGDYILQVEKD